MIKKSWNKFKKEFKEYIKDEGFQYDFSYYMTSRQLANHNATIGVQNTIDYDEEIKRNYADIEKVMGYTSWSDEEKKKCKESKMKSIENAIGAKLRFGDKKAEVEHAMKTLTASEPFKKFCDNAKIDPAFKLEVNNGTYMIRIVW